MSAGTVLSGKAAGAGFLDLLRGNRNYRFTWTGQVVSEIGDHFNNIAVFALVMELTGSGFAVAGVMLARAAGILAAGPVAGVVLDRFDRRRIMVLSDLVRAAVALGFLATIQGGRPWLLFLLNGLLMFASPFFTSGRAAILPAIAPGDDLHTANSLTQTTQWINVALGAFLGGVLTKNLGYPVAFGFNALSFLVSAACIGLLRPPPGASFAAARRDLRTGADVRPLGEYIEGLRYIARTPLVLAIALVGVGWATGGGAAQILFTLFGEKVFDRGAQGIGEVWGCAGIGLVLGGILAHRLGRRLGFEGYKRLIAICYVVHGGSYVLFSLSPSYAAALFFIALSRFAVAISSVLNSTRILRHVPDGFRGRVFSTMESMVWATMVLSMLAAGAASVSIDIRTIGVVSGLLSSTTAIFWGWFHWSGRLPEPEVQEGGGEAVAIGEEARV
jgi:MFS family permease